MMQYSNQSANNTVKYSCTFVHPGLFVMTGNQIAVSVASVEHVPVVATR